MSSSHEKAHVAKPPVQTQADKGSFFRKAGDETFFGPQPTPSFFSASVQPKLEVSQPDDPQEKEADAVADQVMRMAEPAAAAPEEKQEEGVQRKAAPGTLHRQAGMGGFASAAAPTEDEGSTEVQAKALDTRVATFIARSARGPPTAPSAPTFESSLASSKGSGNPLPSETRLSMESRFGADFGGVRIHTGNGAERLSGEISAQAFTHGNDIYFNSGKYQPGTAHGDRLLAHELTHTIQQGASQPTAQAKAARTIQRKGIARSLQRTEAGTQRGAAVEMAKAEVGKVSANKEGPDGLRMGWERLLEFFKTTFGADKILPEGAAFQQGYINEAQIKKKSTFLGDVKGGDGIVTLHNQPRDAMASWCGIFAFWALNKGGIPLRKWVMGGSMIPAEAAYPKDHVPQPGDIAYRQEFSHYALVASSDGANVTSINGNTAGDDNVGGEIQVQTHPKDHWFSFIDPTMMMEGSLRAPNAADNPTAAKPRSLKELRKQLFKVDRQQEASAPAAHTTGVPVARAVEAPAPEAKPKEEEKEEKVQAKADTAARKEGTADSGADKEIDRAAQEPEEKRAPAASPEPRLPPTQEEEKTTAPESVQRQPLSLHNRGPPRAPPSINASIGRKVQRNIFGDAWDAVSDAVSEAAAWVEKGLDKAKEWILEEIREFVVHIKGYKMLCLILGSDPITNDPCPMTGENLLEAGLDILPFGGLFKALFLRLGIYTDVATWLQGRIDDLSALVTDIGSAFSEFFDDLSLDDIGDPDGVMRSVERLFDRVIGGIIAYVENTVSTLLGMIKKVMIREVSAFIRNKIPKLYPLLCVALGFDPQTMKDVPRNGTNILNALLEFHPEGEEQKKQIRESGTFKKVAAFIDEGIGVFVSAYTRLKAAIANIWDFVTIHNLTHPIQTFEKLYDTFAQPIVDVLAWVGKAALKILELIKEVVIKKVSAFARKTRGYPLLCVLIGKDPFTGDRVVRNVDNVVKGFMSLMEGGEQQFEQLKQSGAIDKIVAKVEAAVARLNLTPQAIIALFMKVWRELSLRDLARPLEAFKRVVDTLAQPLLRIIRFVIEIVLIAIEAVLILMSFPFDIVQNILAKARQAWNLIKNDPVGFFKNLLLCVKQGFIQFFDNIATHLINGVVGWLMSELKDAGVPLLTDFSLQGVISWVLQVLGISMEKIWEKLAAHPRIGPERVAKIRSVIDTLEGIWTFIKDVQERGMAAIWDKIQEQLSNLWDKVLEMVKNWIMEKIITAVVTKLLSMLDPTGIMAVINSCIAIYKAVQSFIKYITEMLRVVNSFVEGILAIAEGNIKVGADALEGALGRAMPIVIGFLANQVGLGGIGSKIAELIGAARDLVDKAITWLVNKAVDTAFGLIEKALALGKKAVAAVTGWVGRLLGLEKKFHDEKGGDHRLYFSEQGGGTLMINPQPAGPFQKWVEGIQPDESTAAGKKRAEKKAAAIAKAAEIDKEKAEPAATGTSGAEEKAKEDKAKRIKQLLQELSELVGPLFTGSKPKCSKDAPTGLTLGGKSGGGYGTRMKAATLTNVGMPAGSVPGVTGNKSFDIINQRRNQGGSYYVLGHLLNHNLGGTGTDWTNLTPLTRNANGNHEKKVESLVKGAVDAGNIVHYSVTANYGRSVPKDPDPAIQEIMDQEAHVPVSLSCQADLITPAELSDTGKDVTAPLIPAGTTIENDVEQAHDAYDLVGIKHSPVYLDSSSQAEVAALPGSNAPLAAKIKEFYADKEKSEGTRFSSWESLASYVSTTGGKFTSAQKATLLSMPDYVKLFQK